MKTFPILVQHRCMPVETLVFSEASTYGADISSYLTERYFYS